MGIFCGSRGNSTRQKSPSKQPKNAKDMGETILLSGDIFGETVCAELDDSAENENLAGMWCVVCLSFSYQSLSSLEAISHRRLFIQSLCVLVSLNVKYP
jgi:hypothetical protein